MSHYLQQFVIINQICIKPPLVCFHEEAYAVSHILTVRWTSAVTSERFNILII